ncbi:MAG: DNA polymerase I [Spirochaeta sp. LUC14_002_19_P3]|nr:MAG: DNA polymerase I [Spirochaeta sp. LUC14_002_19_P3]
MNNDIYVLDTYGLIYRAYFALLKNPLTDRNGNNTSAIHGFFRIVLSIKSQFKAERFIAAMDPPGPTFRHLRYPPYKQNRDAAPEDLHSQVQPIVHCLGCLGIPVIRMDGFEADDVMGSIAHYCQNKGLRCHLISSDKDLMQLIGGCVTMLRPEKGGLFQEFDEQKVVEEKGVKPEQIIDYLALIGDSSDNIPGIAGIGPKTASDLLAEWGNLDNLYANLDSAAKGSRLLKLREGYENACMSRELVALRCDLDVSAAVEACKTMEMDFQAAAAFFRERDMRVLADDVSALAAEMGQDTALPEQDAPQREYSAILTVEQLTLWKEKILSTGMAALDTETDGLDALTASLVGVSVAVNACEAAYLPLRRLDGDCLDSDTVLNWLREIFCDSRVKIIGQNFKYDMKVLRRAGVPVGGAWFDTMIAAWILDPSSAVGMDALALRFLNMDTLKFSDVVPKGETFASVPLDKATAYAAEDAAVTFDLYEHLFPLLKDDAQRWDIFWNYEMPLLPILTAMETEGIGLDIIELEAYSKELGAAIVSLEEEIYLLSGKKFNIASPKQLQQILFEERGLQPIKKTKTGFSTDNSVLRDLAGEDPLPEKILLYRSLSKLKSTYVDVLPTMIHPQDARIHTTYSQIGAATGRLSSNNPNLQNIPIRDENGRRIRKAFKSRPGHRFISADYSQIELVILAHLSGDKGLSEAFHSSTDIHTKTAAQLFAIDMKDVTPYQRRAAKAVNFGVMYGMSAFRLANELKISQKEAKHFIDTYFAAYSGIRQFISTTVEQAEKDGGIRTMAGRFRPLPGINSRNRVEKAAAERAAVNSRIQGTAADIIKLAMIAVDKALGEPEARMLLQVHDELLIEAPERESDDIAARIRQAMEGVIVLDIPLKAEVESGVCWGDIH